MGTGKPLLGSDLKVINIGLSLFAETLQQGNVPVMDLNWQPPVEGDQNRTGILRRVQGPSGESEHGTGQSTITWHKDIEEANRTALLRIVDADPTLIDVAAAGEVIPNLQEGTLLHAGPPIDWQEMCGPMRAAISGAMRYEGWASSEEEADALAAGGGIQLFPNHDFKTVGPMAGITSPSMPVFVVENRTFQNRAFCTLNEGLGKVLRFGANDSQVIDRLHWLQNILAPLLGEAVRRAGGIELRPLMARALSMGDEMHQRNVAATSLFLRQLSPHLTRVLSGNDNAGEVMDFLAGNDQFFLNLAMAAGKATMDPVGNIPSSTVVSAMSRNGRDFGIRVSGTGDEWFTAPSLLPKGLYFPGYTADDSNPDLGDSAILETIGLGGFAMGSAPAVVGFVGAGTFQDAVNYTREMDEITIGRNTNLMLPTLDFQGVPSAIDIRKVVESGIAPVINTGIAHQEAGIGQIGAGIVRAPLNCFTQALERLVDRLSCDDQPLQ